MRYVDLGEMIPGGAGGGAKSDGEKILFDVASTGEGGNGS